MPLLDLLGAALTAATLAFLGLGGYLLAVRILPPGERADPLLTAAASLLLALAEALGIGLLLGTLGLLRLPLAFALQAALVLGLLLAARRREGDPWAPLRRIGEGTAAAIRRYPALSLIALHAAGSGALRGLLRPPLSWDSLVYHLHLAGRWLQEGNLDPILGAYPLSYFGYVPANGSVWLWWWLAPSHSELFVNLANLPPLALLALAAGGVARELGARKHWPLASFLTALAPTVIRFAATQYVDIPLAAALLAATLFGLRWLRTAGPAAAALTGAGLGVAAGAKVMGAPFAATLALALLAAARGSWRRRLAGATLAALLAAALGGFFYLRNALSGAGPLALECFAPAGVEASPLPALPAPGSALSDLPSFLGRGVLAPAFFGTPRPGSRELGIGPQALLLLAAVLWLPFARGRGGGAAKFVVLIQVAAHLAFWLAVPSAHGTGVFSNVRYLTAAAGLAFAAAVAIGEGSLGPGWLRGIALALAVQDLLMLGAELPLGARWAIAGADLAAVALGLSPRLRRRLLDRRRWVVAAATAAALAAVPGLAAFRTADRSRALAEEFTAHQTLAPLFAGPWGWLEEHGGAETVAVVGSPAAYFLYPAMGMRLARRAVYVNVNAADHPRAADYPRCDPRGDPAPEAWLANLADEGVRWVVVSRFPGFDFPLEGEWAAARPGTFALRYGDENNRLYERRAPAPGP